MQSAEQSQAFKLLVIDDDPGFLQLVQQAFRDTDIILQTAEGGGKGLRQLYAFQPDLVLLDLLMPEMNGWQTLTHIQEATDTPIIIISAINDADTIAAVLDKGAIDYITKPILSRVLVARVKATLRSLYHLPTPPVAYADSYLLIDLQRQSVVVEGHVINLTTAERKLLFYLVKQANQVCTYSELLAQVWGWEYQESTQYVHVYISRLRRKIEQEPKQPRYLRTIHGIGYQFQPQR